MKTLTVATRAGDLALAQTRIVIAALEKTYPRFHIDIKQVTTDGDIDRKTALWQLKSAGYFTSRIEDILLAGQADFAVHSFKDLPTKPAPGLKIVAVCDRQFPEDCLISTEKIDSIRKLKKAAKVGTSSLRRAVQIKRLRPDLQILPIRGNVTTRIKKLDAGQFDAVILARAALERINLAHRICFCFDPRKFIPAPAQGALAVQTKDNDETTNQLLTVLNDKNSEIPALAERRILITTKCGCHAPVGAFAKLVGGNINITAFISDTDGSHFIKQNITGPADKAIELADLLANNLLNAGGRKILEKMENQQ
jgi:hydroxymethylbilane synthase